MSRMLNTIGIMSMLAFSIVLFITFATAYMSPAKAVVVRINTYGEADVEMVLLAMLLPVSLVSSVLMTRNLHKEEDELKGFGDSFTEAFDKEDMYVRNRRNA